MKKGKTRQFKVMEESDDAFNIHEQSVPIVEEKVDTFFKFPKPESRLEKLERLRKTEDDDNSTRRLIYSIINTKESDSQTTKLRDFSKINKYAKLLVESFPEENVYPILREFIFQSSLKFNEFVTLYMKKQESGSLSTFELESERTFFKNVLSSLRSRDFDRKKIDDLFDMKIQEEENSSSKLIYIEISKLDLELIDRFSSFFLKQFSDPFNIKSLEKKYEEFKPVISRYNSFQNIEKVQTEEMFILPTNLSPELQELMDEKISENTKQVGRNMFSQYLKIISNSTFYTPKSQFTNSVIEEISTKSQTNEQFAEYLADICIYVKYNIPKSQGGIFINLLEAEYYSPSVLVDLPPQDKLPEIYDNKSVTTNIIEKISEKYRDIKKFFVRDFIEYLYKYNNPLSSLKIIEQRYVPSIDLREYRTCENAKDIQDIPTNFLVSYMEDGKMYCFDSRVLVDSIARKEDVKNPYTDKDIPYDVLYNAQLLLGYTPECYNFRDRANIPKKFLVSYTVNDRKYCFDSRTIFSLLQSGTRPENPYTKTFIPESTLDIVRGMNSVDDDIDNFTDELTPALISIVRGNIAKLSKQSILPEVPEPISKDSMILEDLGGEFKPFYDILYGQIRNQMTEDQFISFCGFLSELSTSKVDITKPCNNIKVFRAYLQAVIYENCEDVIISNIVDKIDASSGSNQAINISDIINLNYGHRNIIEKYISGDLNKDDFVSEYKASILCKEESTRVVHESKKKRYEDILFTYSCPLVGSVEIQVLETTFSVYDNPTVQLKVFVKPSSLPYRQAKSRFEYLSMKGESTYKLKSVFNSAKKKFDLIQKQEDGLRNEIKKTYEESSSSGFIFLPIIYDIDRKMFTDGFIFSKIYIPSRFTSKDFIYENTDILDVPIGREENEEEEEEAKEEEEQDEEEKQNDTYGSEEENNDNEENSGGESDIEGAGENVSSTTESEEENGDLKTCKKCKSPVKDENLKTIMFKSSKKKPEINVIYFCSIKCFDDYDLSKKEKTRNK